MKSVNKRIFKLFSILFVAMLAVTLAACSDDDNGVVKVNFDESSIAGTWQVTEMDSVQISVIKGVTNRNTFETRTYDDLYVNFNNGNYNIWQGSASNSLEHGTYNLVTGSFRIDLSSGTRVHWLKGDNSSMTLEVYSAYSENRVARYTLRKSN